MTLGEKLLYLRTEANLSQEQLAEEVSVSRQSVSKWEMDQALPQIDKVLLLCSLFHVSADELLRDDVPLKSAAKQSQPKNKYFGTDGFRGEVNVNLTSIQAYKIGRFLGWYYALKQKAGYKPRIVVGKDTRRSSYNLEYSIVAGITASGADAYMLHVTTTPSVSYVTVQDGFDCGIMITASHNPFYDNGIKVLNRYGEKLDDATTSLIESYLDGDLTPFSLSGDDLPFATGERIGCIVDYVAGRNRYIAYLISLASYSYRKLRIGLDCANGSSWSVAGAVFGALGAHVELIGTAPNGVNINENCGSTHIENLCRLVKERHLDVGFAFDGDADRCIAVDETGKVVDGDGILYVLGKRLHDRGMLNNDTVVSTIMSNSGLQVALEKIGIKNEQTTVGDRFVYECMQQKDYSLGGENSGHIILKKYATTGDGILTAIMLTEELCASKQSLSKLCEPLKYYPQVTHNLRVKDKASVLEDQEVQTLRDSIEKEINGKGRVLLRQSGTEPLIRIMVECEDENQCNSYALSMAQKIRERGHCIE